YTKNRQYGTNDHVGDYEGFKVEDLSYQGGFGHENIQKNAIDRSGIQELRKEKNIQYLYRGNWLKDYAQLIAPFLFDPSAALDGINEIPDYCYCNSYSDRIELKQLLEDAVRILAIQKFYTKERKIIARKAYYENPTKWRLIPEK
ncbi:hypothetical protein, partial [Bacteroides ovatus]